MANLGSTDISALPRYQLPDTNNFNRLRRKEGGISLRELSFYAEAERQSAYIGHLLGRSLLAPLNGPIFYSPGGAAVVERAREFHADDPEIQRAFMDMATGKWYRAVVATPATAVLGLGEMPLLDGTRLAGTAGPIMIGKAAYFLWTAGVNTEPRTVPTRVERHQEVELVQAQVQNLMDYVVGVETLNTPLDPRQQGYLRTRLNKLATALVPLDLDRGSIALGETERSAIIQALIEDTNRYLTNTRHEPLHPGQRNTLEARLTRLTNDEVRKYHAYNFARHVYEMRHDYSFFNVEDAQGKDLPLILGYLKEKKDMRGVVWSDDLQGTGVIAAAATLSWADLTNRMKGSSAPLKGTRVIIYGAGAGAMGVYQALVDLGVDKEDILVLDSKGPLHQGRTDIASDDFKVEMSRVIPSGTTVDTFLEYPRGVDAVINLGAVETVTRNGGRDFASVIERLNDNPLVLALTNPDPGITPEQLRAIRSDAIYGSGNQIYENTVNNFTAFGYIGLGSMLAHANQVNASMTTAAAWGIHRTAKKNENYSINRLVPMPTDTRLIKEEAGAVAMAALVSGASLLAGSTTPDEFQIFLDEELALREIEVLRLRQESEANAERHLRAKFKERYAPFFWNRPDIAYYYVAPEIRGNIFERILPALGLTPSNYQDLFIGSVFNPRALTDVLETNRTHLLGVQKADAESLSAAVAVQEMGIILWLFSISPELALSLALLRRQLNVSEPNNLGIFRDDAVVRLVTSFVPEAIADIDELNWYIARRNGSPAGGAPSGGEGDAGLSGARSNVSPGDEYHTMPLPLEVDQAPLEVSEAVDEGDVIDEGDVEWVEEQATSGRDDIVEYTLWLARPKVSTMARSARMVEMVAHA